MITLRQSRTKSTATSNCMTVAIWRYRLLTLAILFLMPMSAQAERLDWDYSAAQKISVKSNESDLLIFRKVDTRGYLLTRLIIEGSSAEDWTESLEIMDTSRSGQPKDAIRWFEEFRSQEEEICQSEWELLQETKTSIMFERQFDRCPPTGAQQALYRILYGNKSVFVLVATRTEGMDAEARDSWIRLLESADIKPSTAAVRSDQLTKRNGRVYAPSTLSRPPAYTGPLRDYYPNGQRRQAADYVKGKLEGLYTIWYAPSQNGREGNAVKEKRDDSYRTEWHADGHKRREVNFVDGKAEGLYTTWHENGQKYWDVMMVRGEREGPVTLWYENGLKEAEGNYVNGKREGHWVVWHDNGQKEFEGTYRNGKDEPGSTWWDEDGNTKESDKKRKFGVEW